jgi:hypothetical protein
MQKMLTADGELVLSPFDTVRVAVYVPGTSAVNDGVTDRESLRSALLPRGALRVQA